MHYHFLTSDAESKKTPIWKVTLLLFLRFHAETSQTFPLTPSADSHLDESCQELCQKKNISDTEKGPQTDVQRAFEPLEVWPFPPTWTVEPLQTL